MLTTLHLLTALRSEDMGGLDKSNLNLNLPDFFKVVRVREYKNVM